MSSFSNRPILTIWGKIIFSYPMMEITSHERQTLKRVLSEATLSLDGSIRLTSLTSCFQNRTAIYQPRRRWMQLLLNTSRLHWPFSLSSHHISVVNLLQIVSILFASLITLLCSSVLSCPSVCLWDESESVPAWRLAWESVPVSESVCVNVSAHACSLTKGLTLSFIEHHRKHPWERAGLLYRNL